MLWTGIESAVSSEEAPNLLETVKVFDLNGNEIPISDLWKDRKAVVAFARHFGFGSFFFFTNLIFWIFVIIFK